MKLIDTQRREGKEITIDLNLPDLALAASDRRAYSAHPDAVDCAACEQFNGQVVALCGQHTQRHMARARLLRQVIRDIVTTKYRQGMKRTDGKVWGAWTEVLDEIDDTGTTTVTVSVAMLKWLHKAAKDDGLETRALIAQAREVLVAFLRAVLTDAGQEADE